MMSPLPSQMLTCARRLLLVVARRVRGVGVDVVDPDVGVGCRPGHGVGPPAGPPRPAAPGMARPAPRRPPPPARHHRHRGRPHLPTYPRRGADGRGVGR